MLFFLPSSSEATNKVAFGIAYTNRHLSLPLATMHSSSKPLYRLLYHLSKHLSLCFSKKPIFCLFCQRITACFSLFSACCSKNFTSQCTFWKHIYKCEIKNKNASKKTLWDGWNTIHSRYHSNCDPKSPLWETNNSCALTLRFSRIPTALFRIRAQKRWVISYCVMACTHRHFSAPHKKDYRLYHSLY